MKYDSLDNCKHCGGPGEIKEFKGMFRHGWVGCPSCGIYKNWSHDPTEAIRIWNMRYPAHAVKPKRSETNRERAVS